MQFDQDYLAKDEIEISIKRIVKTVIKNTKWIVIGALIVALLLPMVVYIKDKKEYNALTSAQNEMGLTESDEIAIETYFYLRDKEEECEQFCANAPIMKVDYSKVYMGTLELFIISDINNDISERMAQTLYNYLSNYKFVEDLGKLIGLEDCRLATNLVSVNAENIPLGILEISIVGESQNVCEEYVDTTIQILNDKVAEFQLDEECYDLKFIKGEIQVTESLDVGQVHYNNRQKLENARNELKNYTNTLTDTQKKFIQEISNEDSEISINTILKPEFSLKYVILGFILGIIVICVGIVFVVLFDGKLQSPEELYKRFRLTSIGYISKYTNDSEIERMSAYMTKLLENNNSNQFIYLSTLGYIEDERIKKINSQLCKENISCGEIKNVISISDEIASLSKTRSIILLESIGQSKIKNIYEEMAVCQNLGMHVIGYITIED